MSQHRRISYWHRDIVRYGLHSNDEYMYQGHDDEDTGVIYIEPRSAAYEFADQILLGYTDKSYG